MTSTQRSVIPRPAVPSAALILVGRHEAGAIATVLNVAVLIHMLGFVPGGGGPTIYYLAAFVAGGVTFVLLMIVMRGLLESAIADRAELDAVI